MNWKEWQLCYRCAKKIHPKAYKDIPNHGTGCSRMVSPPKPQSLYELVLAEKITNRTYDFK